MTLAQSFQLIRWTLARPTTEQAQFRPVMTIVSCLFMLPTLALGYFDSVKTGIPVPLSMLMAAGFGQQIFMLAFGLRRSRLQAMPVVQLLPFSPSAQRLHAVLFDLAMPVLLATAAVALTPSHNRFRVLSAVVMAIALAVVAATPGNPLRRGFIGTTFGASLFSLALLAAFYLLPVAAWVGLSALTLVAAVLAIRRQDSVLASIPAARPVAGAPERATNRKRSTGHGYVLLPLWLFRSERMTQTALWMVILGAGMPFVFEFEISFLGPIAAMMAGFGLARFVFGPARAWLAIWPLSRGRFVAVLAGTTLLLALASVGFDALRFRLTSDEGLKERLIGSSGPCASPAAGEVEACERKLVRRWDRRVHLGYRMPADAVVRVPVRGNDGNEAVVLQPSPSVVAAYREAAAAKLPVMALLQVCAVALAFLLAGKSGAERMGVTAIFLGIGATLSVGLAVWLSSVPPSGMSVALVALAAALLGWSAVRLLRPGLVDADRS